MSRNSHFCKITGSQFGANLQSNTTIDSKVKWGTYSIWTYFLSPFPRRSTRTGQRPQHRWRLCWRHYITRIIQQRIQRTGHSNKINTGQFEESMSKLYRNNMTFSPSRYFLRLLANRGIFDGLYGMITWQINSLIQHNSLRNDQNSIKQWALGP